MSVIRDQFSVGGIATARCISDAQAIRMEWLNNGVIVASDTNTRELNLTFSPVNDSIHNLVYVCRVTRNGEEGTLIMAVQNFTVTVAGEIILVVQLKSLLCLSHSQFLLLSSIPL